jgi:hypothetical protein
MADQLVDTNVLIVGSAAVAPGYGEVSVGADDIDTVFRWLAEFRDDAARKLVLDDAWKIYEEYTRKLSGQHFGLQVVHHKLQDALRTVPVAYDEDGHGVVPAALAAIDNSDKKFVAAALNDPADIHIVNAADSDWRQQVQTLAAHRIVVVELLP